ncbi:MAG: diacylglycerol kinase family lipid kinase [Ardenticatenia bacterium]|nr:diacylglycerol kinase family lipid kinase [Ardenticatenia bacterium]
MKAFLIVNPVAGSTAEQREELRAAAGYLAEQGWTITWRETTPTRSATVLAREAVQAGADVVVAAGGDGTINEAIQPLVGTPVRFGVLPVGTANLWSIEIGVATAPVLFHQNLKRAAEVLVHGETVAVDTGLAGSRYFLLLAGVGFDALITRLVDRPIKERLGGLAYVWRAIQELPRYHGSVARLVIDGTVYERRVVLVTVSNTKLYAGLPLAPDASFVDGKFNITVLEGRGWFSLLVALIPVVVGWRVRPPTIHRCVGSTVEITASHPLPVQVDGEPAGETPMSFRVVPASLRAIVPPETAARLRAQRTTLGGELE